MLNNAPNKPSKYNQGLYVPVNKNKVIELNNQGGLYYRSGLEKKMMIYLDMNENIILWGSENIKIPYSKTEWENGTSSLKKSNHNYFPDFYYEIKKPDGTISKVVAEVKPSSETTEPILKERATSKQLVNFEYALKMYNKNLSKWKAMIEYCQRKGFQFIIITEKQLGK
jgi:hypothetical protein